MEYQNTDENKQWIVKRKSTPYNTIIFFWSSINWQFYLFGSDSTAGEPFKIYRVFQCSDTAACLQWGPRWGNLGGVWGCLGVSRWRRRQGNAALASLIDRRSLLDPHRGSSSLIYVLYCTCKDFMFY